MVNGGYGNHDSREKKRAISHFTGNKKGRSRVRETPFTTLCIQWGALLKVVMSMKTDRGAGLRNSGQTLLLFS